MKLTTFINLSGGVDSTYYLWRWLTENPTETILVHHCLFFKSRVKEEKRAVDDILGYLRKQGLTNFKYVETGMQKGTLTGRVIDIEALSSISAVVIKCHTPIKNVLLSYCAEECPQLSQHLKTKGIDTFSPSHRYSRVNRVLETITERSFSYLCYHGKDGGLMSKKEMIETMPQELLEMTWFCREPRGGKPCGDCFNCKRCMPAIRKRKNEGI